MSDKQTWADYERGDFPALKSISTEAGGAVLTQEVLDNFFAKLTSPEYAERQRQAEEAHYAMLDEMNRRLKESWAAHLGKSADELTKEDMDALNEELFQSWLRYKGVTEKEFWDWIG